VSPGVVRVGPDLSSSPSGGDPLGRWLEPALESAGELLDVVTHHQYDGHDTVAGRAEALDRLHDFLEKRGARQPVWLTEIGWDTGGGVPADVQATLLRGTFAEMGKRAWWSKTFWYDSHGPGWGLFEPDASSRRGEPRPAFREYANVIRAAAPAPLPHPPLDADDAQTIVERAYQAILGRRADSIGGQAHTTLLLADFDVARLCSDLFTSSEFSARRANVPPEELVRSLYAGILDREPDPDGLVHTLAEVKEGRLGVRAAVMLQSEEFRTRFLS
jgi:hypothetical protein